MCLYDKPIFLLGCLFCKVAFIGRMSCTPVVLKVPNLANRRTYKKFDGMGQSDARIYTAYSQFVSNLKRMDVKIGKKGVDAIHETKRKYYVVGM